MLHIVCLHDKHPKGGGLRVGAVRRPPRGVPKEDIDEYDVWLPYLAPSAELLRKYRARERDCKKQGRPVDGAFQRFLASYRTEMKRTDRKHLIPLLAALSKTTDFTVGCYCEDKEWCHRQVLHELLKDAGAKLAKLK